jgi:hypothetical protein
MFRTRFCILHFAFCILQFLFAAAAIADTQTWTGNAASVPQISTITVASTWLDTETATVTINGKDLVVTLVGNESTANVATAIKEMWMSSSRLDGTATTDATSNAGGQQFGEFAEVTATVSGSVVTLVAETPGKPFTVSVSETSSSGTLTLATPQAATGKHHWDNADNWDTGAAPANDDVLVFRDSDVSCLYGLPNGSLEVTIQQYQSFTGQIGLPVVNRDDPNKPYYEYRQRYVRLDDAGSGSNIAHRFGIGVEGTGSPLINLKHSTVKCSPIVYRTGVPKIPGTKALNLCCSTNTSTLNILGGSVDYSSQDGGTSAFVEVDQAAGDSRGIQAIHTTGAVVTLSGGTALIGGTGAINTVKVRGGALRLENQTGTITNFSAYTGGKCAYASTATITSFSLDGGEFDAREDAGAFTITSGTIVRAGSKFLDPQNRMVIGTAFGILFDPSPDLQFGGAADNTISISN